MDRARFSKLASWALVYTLAVVLWGAYVRASGSGAGCGAHWPLCNGEVIPHTGRIETLIELSHRITAGLSVAFGAAVAFFGVRLYPKRHRVRRAAIASFAFVMGEALIGAALVLYKLVAHDDSMQRAISMPLHLVNTFFLMGALAMTAWWSREKSPNAITMRKQGALGVLLVTALVAVLLVATSGALAALGDTLFPPQSVTGALTQDLSGGANALVRLRLLHPLFALLAAAATMAAATTARLLRPNEETRVLSRVAILLIFSQIGAGLANVVLLAPVWMQLVHLLLAECTWVSLVLLAVAALSAEKPSAALLEQIQERARA